VGIELYQFFISDIIVFVQFDFDSAQKKLEECEKLVDNDFFLHIHRNQFMHEARMLICEMYCTIHSKVDLSMLAEKLKLADEETERYVTHM
jgi:translation initiation factor 3 subunit E